MSFHKEFFIDSIKYDCRAYLNGKIPIPKELKDRLRDTVIITNTINSGFLRIYTQDEFDELLEWLNLLNPMDSKVKRLKKLILDESIKTVIDKQNLMTIPNELLERICTTPDDICMLESKGSILICSSHFYNLVRDSLNSD